MQFDKIDFSTSAYLADTTHLSCIQHGAYTLILFAMWRAGGRLPDDDRYLANVVRLSVPKWRKISAPVRALLIADDGMLTQKRLHSDIEKVKKTSLVNAQNGSAGGIAKSLKNKEPDIANADGSPQGRQPFATNGEIGGSLSFLEEDKIQTLKEERKKEANVILWPADSWDQFYKRYPNKVGKRSAVKAFAAAKKRCASLDVMLVGLDRYVATKPTDRPWCNPSTWLNQDRWDDRPARPPPLAAKDANREDMADFFRRTMTNGRPDRPTPDAQLRGDIPRAIPARGTGQPNDLSVFDRGDHGKLP